VLSWSKSKEVAAVPTQLTNDLQVLVERKIIDKMDYWQRNAVAGGRCDGELVAELLLKAAKQFAPADSLDSAVSVLRGQQVVTSATYWQENSVKGKECSGTHVSKVIQNLARRLAEKK
jgi:hypothetical protein